MKPLTPISTSTSPSNAALEYCNREIAKCQDMIRIWPHEKACLLKLIAGWQRTKRQLR
ncbi:hypothetical protein [Shewanella denitrificans]|uniref:hypothetical protein n=1 Tax=Shewanella denitrificans TaxID=192073 RepID=UPI0002D82189|nr:hypothetical protein [Shewanella denitrificans]